MKRALLAAAAAALLLAGCGKSSSYEYLSSREEALYLKVPKQWAVYDQADLKNQQRDRVWFRGFDGSAQADPGHISTFLHDEPRGFADISLVDGLERDLMSFAWMRRVGSPLDEMGNPVDPYEVWTADPDGPIKLLLYNEFDDDATRGIHMRAAFTMAGQTYVVDQSIRVDNKTSRRYLLHLGCSSACWNAHEKTFEEVIESWTVEARS